MFRTQENVPSIYVESSRDFQLFCRLLDVIQGSTKYSIDSVMHAHTTEWCNDSLLNLLCSKVGFTTNKNISTEALRYTLRAFPQLIRYKGSKRGVQYAINLFQRVIHDNNSGVFIDWSSVKETGELTIHFEYTLREKSLLEELLRYILPCGLTYSFGSAAQPVLQTTMTLDTTLTSIDIRSTTELQDSNSFSVNESVIYKEDVTDESTITDQ